MNKEEMFEDFKLIVKMKCPNKCKVGMLTHLFTVDEGRWRVTGITKNALNKLNENEFKKRSGCKLNRAHIHPRSKTYIEMLSRNFKNANEWWQYYYDHDETTLATSTENLTGNFSKIIPIDPSTGLFRTSGYSWKHRKLEIDFLKQVYLNDI